MVSTKDVLLVALLGPPEGVWIPEDRGAEPDNKELLSEAGNSVGAECGDDECGVVE